MTVFLRILTGLLVAASALPAHSQTSDKDIMDDMMQKIAGTQRVYTQPLMMSGKLTGCQYVFEGMLRDYTYRAGQFIKVDGSIGIMTVQGKLASTVKVVVNEITPPSLSFKPSPPTRAYLIGADFRTNLASLVAASESDTPGALFAIYQLSPTFEILAASLKTKKLSVAFNSRGGATDITMPLDLEVATTDKDGNRTRNSVAIEDFGTCLGTMAAAMK